MDALSVLDVFRTVVRAVSDSLAGVRDWGMTDERHGQYHADVLANDAALPILRSHGFGILSEESGSEDLSAPIIVCLDPLDGSTNASRGVPHFATSLCAFDADGPWVALVAHQAMDQSWWAIRGEGAHRSRERLGRNAVPRWEDALVAISGHPPTEPGWQQFRAFGAAAIDLCLVADGTVDAFIDMSPSAHGVWDYAAGMLICKEAGVEVRDALGRDLAVLDHSARRTPVAAPPELLSSALAVRNRL